jgi:DNA-directed RNA polymerase subunit RPC12/RpoP
MTRSAPIALVCIAAIAAAVVYLVQRPRSAAERERDAAGWRICAQCGHEWHLELGEIASQMKQNPDGVGAVRCPKCGAWRGMARAQCSKCHKSFPSLVPVETDDGIRLDKQRSCPHCRYAFGTAETTGDSTRSE